MKKKNNKRSSKVDQDKFYEKLKKSFHEKFPIESEESDGIEFRAKSLMKEHSGESSIISLYYESELGVTKISAVHNAATREEWLSMVRHLNLIRDVDYCVKYQNFERMETGIMGYIHVKDVALFKNVLGKIVEVNSILFRFRAVQRELEEEMHWRNPSMCED